MNLQGQLALVDLTVITVNIAFLFICTSLYAGRLASTCPTTLACTSFFKHRDCTGWEPLVCFTALAFIHDKGATAAALQL